MILNLIHMVRTNEHDSHPSQLHHPRNVPAVHGRRLQHNAMSGAGRIRPLHLRFFRHRNDHQSSRHGLIRQADVFSRHLESPGYVYSCSRVSWPCWNSLVTSQVMWSSSSVCVHAVLCVFVSRSV